MTRMHKRAVLLLSGIVLIALIVLPSSRALFLGWIALFQGLDLEVIKAYILSFGVWAPLISFALMVFQSVMAPLPAFLITFANAALFGWLWGAALSWTSAMAGALLCFYIARFLGREVVEKLTSKMALESVDAFFEKHGVYAILIARLLPFISFDVVSYAAGLTSMRLSSFVIATGIGQLPATLVYSYAGEMLTGGARTFVYGLLILFSVTILVYLIKRVYRGR
ncbi:MAG: TVP38/TMEM64 family protein [Epsilonproteobacteria bacterium]|nr:TVP38/TMEM64 family protein [Campylobacterota bacterium]